MKSILLIVVLACASLSLISCGTINGRAAKPTPPLLLISMDAFRWDYCALHPAQTPTLRRLMAEGVSARGLIPVYPSNTFPNHYTIVTGLYPSHHGIINNEFFDRRLGAYFHYNRLASTSQSQWWGGEPIWVTAARQGKKTAVSFWVGSEAEIDGVRPTYWRPFDAKLPFEQRLQDIAGWLKLPPEKIPQLFVVYLEEGNLIGHKFGPDSPELMATVQHLDDSLAKLLATFRDAGVEPNVVIVSDHGMTPISKERVILLDDFVMSADVQVDFDGPVAGLRAVNGDVDHLIRSLLPLQHAKAYRTTDLPSRFHIGETDRTPDVWIVPEEGWEIYFRTHFAVYREKFNHGDHGYDPAFPSMRGIFVAHGPSFKAKGQVLDAEENVHVYNLLCAALQLKPAANDGDDRLARAVMRP